MPLVSTTIVLWPLCCDRKPANWPGAKGPQAMGRLNLGKEQPLDASNQPVERCCHRPARGRDQW